MTDVFHCDPDLAVALRAAGVSQVDDLLRLGGEGSELAYRGFVELPVAGTGGRFYVKRYAYPDWRAAKGLLGRGTLWGRAPEVNEYRALCWLRSHAVGAVRPVAAAARTRAGRLCAHALLTEVVPGAIDLGKRLRSAEDDLLSVGVLRRALVVSLGRDLARMHALGFAHRDCHARNILVRADPEGVRSWFLDCRRGGGGRRRGPLYDLACLDNDLQGRLTRGDRLRGLRAYLGSDADARSVARRIARLRDTLPRPRPQVDAPPADRGPGPLGA